MTIEDTMIDTENKEEDLIDKLTEEVKYLRENVDKLTEENLELKRDIRNKDLCITKLIISPDQKDLEEFRNQIKTMQEDIADLKGNHYSERSSRDSSVVSSPGGPEGQKLN